MNDSQNVVIVGAGGFGREVLQIVRASMYSDSSLNFCGFVDNQRPDENLLLRIKAPYLGNDDDFLHSPSVRFFVLAIGNHLIRQEVASRYLAAGLSTVNVIHPNAFIGDDVEVGIGIIVSPFACITTHITIGDFVHVDRSTNIGHDSRIGNFVTIHPGAIVSGSVLLADGVTIGAGACIMPGVSIGENAVVGAGAVVTKDISQGDTVAGVPARSRARRK